MQPTNNILKAVFLLVAVGLGSRAGLARVDSYYYLQSFFGMAHSELYWPDRHYISMSQADASPTLTFTNDRSIDLVALADKGGKLLKARKLC